MKRGEGTHGDEMKKQDKTLTELEYDLAEAWRNLWLEIAKLLSPLLSWLEKILRKMRGKIETR